MTQCHPFTRLLPEQSTLLYRRALRLTGNAHRAEDLVQATLLKAWASRESYVPDTNLRAWLFTILRNTFLTELRKYRLEVEDCDGAKAQSLWEEASQDHVLALKELIAAVALLPDAQRVPLVMMGMYGFSQLEVANACGCTLGTVKSRVSRGRATLIHLLAHDAVEVAAPRPQMAVSADAGLHAGHASGGRPMHLPLPAFGRIPARGKGQGADVAMLRSAG